MRKTLLSRRVCGAALMLAVAACSHTPEPGDIPPGANFTTHILDNGTKLFTYAVRQGRPGGGGGDGGMGGGGDRPEGGGMGRPSRSGRDTQLGLQAMLMQNTYCREGYVVLEQYETMNQFVIRGECREAANDDDRARFTH